MDEVEQRVNNLRRFFASTVCLTESTDHDQRSDMTDYNSKVDLRPQWMVNDNDIPQGKPHVDSVLQPSQRFNGIPRSMPRLSPEMLQNANLRETGLRNSIDSEGRRTVQNSLNSNLVPQNPIPARNVNVFEFQVNSQSNTGGTKPPPPPPLPQQAQPNLIKHVPLTERKDSIDYRLGNPPPYLGKCEPSPTIIKDSVHRNVDQEIELLRRQVAEMESIVRSRTNTGISMPNQSSQMTSDDKFETSSVISGKTVTHSPMANDNNIKVDKNFNFSELNNSQEMKTWIDQMVNDKFERASRVDETKTNLDERNDFEDYKQRSRSKQSRKGRTRKRSSSQDSRVSRKSQVSLANSFESAKSATKSIRSVLFKGVEEEELHSEVDEDDIADMKIGDTDFIDTTSAKFVIHGPFMDKELNVFHAICVEYMLAARMSFAKRSPFSRTNAAHERVYALLGSNRRSLWTNMNSWHKATNDLRILDFLFRKTIRSQSKRIKQPVMEIEHFTENSTLTTGRFKRIIHSVFKTREYLAKTLGINVDRFDDIK